MVAPANERRPGLKELPQRIIRVIYNADGGMLVANVLGIRFRHEHSALLDEAIRGLPDNATVDLSIDAEVKAEGLFGIIEIRSGGEDGLASIRASSALGDEIHLRGALSWARDYTQGHVMSDVTIAKIEKKAQSVARARDGRTPGGLIVPGAGTN